LRSKATVNKYEIWSFEAAANAPAKEFLEQTRTAADAFPEHANLDPTVIPNEEGGNPNL